MLHTHKLVVRYELQKKKKIYIYIYEDRVFLLIMDRLIMSKQQLACRRSPTLRIRALGLGGTSIRYPSIMENLKSSNMVLKKYSDERSVCMLSGAER